MSQNQTESLLKHVLERFEVSLETPVVPGELESWVAEVCSALNDLDAMLLQAVERTHREQFAQIEREDPGLCPKVEALRKEDAAIRQQFEALRLRVDYLAQAVPNIEPNEAAIQQRVDLTVEEGLALVIRARRQEVATATWLVESLDRDRGTAD